MAINVMYQVYTGGRWLSNVTDLTDYAGIYGSPIQGVYASLSSGSIQYRTHTQGGDWLPWVTDRTDYAGVIGTNIDGIQMQVIGLSGYQARYRAYVGGMWLPWVTGLEDYAGIYGAPIEAIQVEIVANSGGSGSIDAIYQVYTGGRWLPNVTNSSDYAGIYGSPIQGVYASLSSGSIQYRVHTINGSWLPWVTDRTDYAGVIGTNIDGLQMQVIGLSGHEARYRAYVGGRWLPWVTGLEDYAGLYGQAIEGIQVEIILGGSGGSGGSGGGDPILPPVPGGRKVFIDPGHGGSDPGAGGNGIDEKNVVLSISKKVGNILTKKGVTVEYSRTTDDYVTLAGRAQMANEWGASLFVSIHANSNEGTAGTGTECYTYPSTNSANKQLSANVAKAISNKLGITNRGHKEADFAVLRLTNMPAILVETAFINNAYDAILLKGRQDDFAEAIANEILKYLGESTFDLDAFLRDASNRGFFRGKGISFKLDARVLLATIWVSPKITIEGEVSLTQKIKYPTEQYIKLSEDTKAFAKRLYDLLKDQKVVFDFTLAELELSLKHIKLTTGIDDMIKIECKTTEEKTEITIEASYKYNAEVTGFQRLIITVENYDNLGYVRVPIARRVEDVEPNTKKMTIEDGWICTGLAFTVAFGRVMYNMLKSLYRGSTVTA